jgi:hypothetical protein
LSTARHPPMSCILSSDSELSRSSLSRIVDIPLQPLGHLSIAPCGPHHRSDTVVGMHNVSGALPDVAQSL